MFPPEINSARMYAGPGAEPMLTAAAAWDELGASLYSTASSYESEVTGLAAGWRGSSSESMTSAVAPYLAWMTATAAQAEFVAAKAKMVAGAYEEAFAQTVPPAVIAANRALLLELITTNFFGQNTPAIAVTETHYAEMWVQDAQAMYNYAATLAGASTPTPFSPPTPTTNPSGPAAQLAALAQAVGRSVALDAARPFPRLHELIHVLSKTIRVEFMGARVGSTPFTYMLSMIEGTNMGGMLQRFALGKLGTLLTRAALSRTLNPIVSASLANASSIGRLSVPPSWIAAAPSASPTPTAAAGGPSTTSGTPWIQLAFAGIAGAAVGAVGSRRRATVIPCSPAAG